MTRPHDTNGTELVPEDVDSASAKPVLIGFMFLCFACAASAVVAFLGLREIVRWLA